MGCGRNGTGGVYITEAAATRRSLPLEEAWSHFSFTGLGEVELLTDEERACIARLICEAAGRVGVLPKQRLWVTLAPVPWYR